jgi:hypothetical protein
LPHRFYGGEFRIWYLDFRHSRRLRGSPQTLTKPLLYRSSSPGAKRQSLTRTGVTAKPKISVAAHPVYIAPHSRTKVSRNISSFPSFPPVKMSCSTSVSRARSLQKNTPVYKKTHSNLASTKSTSPSQLLGITDSNHLETDKTTKPNFHPWWRTQFMKTFVKFLLRSPVLYLHKTPVVPRLYREPQNLFPVCISVSPSLIKVRQLTKPAEKKEAQEAPPP